MEPFIWSEVFETGLEEVDRQHQALVQLVNTIGDTVTCEDNQVVNFNGVFAELAAYAKNHFLEEEELMTAHRLDPRHCEQHKKEHANFIEDAGNMHAQLVNKSTEDTKRLFDFLMYWLVYHILGSDKNMAAQIKAITSGKTPAEAYEAEEQTSSSRTEPLLVALKGLFDQVSIRNKELFQLNQQLEERVSERTRELLKANKDLELLALTDPLTKLPNRRMAMQQLDILWQEADKYNQPFSCMVVDADGFKEVNDTFGHDAGDSVLITLSQNLRDAVRTDDTVCRMGGDEFLIICPSTPLDGAMFLAEQMRKKVAAINCAAGEGFWKGSISIGVAEKSNGIQGVNDLLKAADKGVYKAKSDGKNCARTTQVNN